MTSYIVFDNEGRTPDRYTIIDRESGNVIAAGEPGSKGRYGTAAIAPTIGLSCMAPAGARCP